jgi:hypothetical protein
MAFIVKRDAPVIPAGIPVASTNNIIMAGSGPRYTSYFGPGNADGVYVKESATVYRLDFLRTITYDYGYLAWIGYWDNGDNSYPWVISDGSNELYIPTSWNYGITITAA